MSVTIRSAKPGEDKTLVDLYNHVFDQNLTTQVWDWRYRQNPLRQEPFSLVAERDGQIVSHYGASLVQFSVNGQAVSGALYIDAFTDPKVTGLKLFKRLGLALEDDLKAAGVQLLLAFPNEISHRLFYHDLGWRDILEVPMLRANRDQIRGVVNRDPAIAESSQADSSFDSLWQRLQHSAPLMTVRDSSYLNYRYFASAKHDYTVYTVGSSRELSGFAVAKSFAGGVDLMDVFADDEYTAVRLVDHVLATGMTSGAGEFNAWLPVRHPMHHYLERRGFENQAPVVYMMAKVIGEIPDDAPDIFDARNWFYTMGDSDVY